jgi:hypothetical protein
MPLAGVHIAPLARGPVASNDRYFSAAVSQADQKLPDRLAHSIDPLDYGARCNGVADDTEALIAAAARAAQMPSGVVVSCRLRIGGVAGIISAPIRFEVGGSLDLQLGGSVTLSGSLDAPYSRIFEANGGTITFAPGMTRAFFAEWWGAKADDSTPSRLGIQAAIDAAASVEGSVELLDGTYVVDGNLTFTRTTPVRNGMPFGLSVRGRGMGTVIKTTAAAGQLFDLDAGATNLQIHMSSLQACSVTGGVIGVLIGNLARYSVFENVRLLGFRQGLRFRRANYGLTFRDLYVRGSHKEAIAVDSESLGGNVITEVRFFGGYIDNNGASVREGMASVPALYLYNAQEWRFFGVVMEGNYGGGIQMAGSSRNISFFGCRLEETLVRFGAAGHIHDFATTVRNVNFYDCQLAYNRAGVAGTKIYHLFHVSDGAGPVRILNSHIVDTSNVNPTDVFGTTSPAAQIEVQGLLNGVAGRYAVRIPPRYLGRVLGNVRHTFGAALPAAGACSVGDIIWNTAPHAGGPPGWVCTAGGTPGTWKAMANLAR